MFNSNCCFFTCIQVSQEAGRVVWYSHLCRSRCFSGIHCFLYDPTDVGNLISGPSALSESSLYIWEFSVHVLLKPSLKDFEHYLDSMWNEHNCTVVWVSFSIDFFGDWNENWPFPVLWPLLSFPNCRHYRYIHLSFSLISHLIAWGEFWELRDQLWFKSKM